LYDELGVLHRVELTNGRVHCPACGVGAHGTQAMARM
jgi:hypothetical protein